MHSLVIQQLHKLQLDLAAIDATGDHEAADKIAAIAAEVCRTIASQDAPRDRLSAAENSLIFRAYA